jgi:hypothetical protein
LLVRCGADGSMPKQLKNGSPNPGKTPSNAFHQSSSWPKDLKFSKATDVAWVLKYNWSIDSSPLLLKQWNLLFDPNNDIMEVARIWVRLPRFPLELWTLDGFLLMGNMIGSFLEVDMSCQSRNEMTVARILVMVDLRGGLAEEMTLKIGEKDVIQKMDYEGISFRCRKFHKHGHIAIQCSLPFHGQKGGSQLPRVKKRLTNNNLDGNSSEGEHHELKEGLNVQLEDSRSHLENLDLEIVKVEEANQRLHPVIVHSPHLNDLSMESCQGSSPPMGTFSLLPFLFN